MPNTKKPNKDEAKKQNSSNPEAGKKRSDNNNGAVNQGNLSDSVRSRETGELHSKKGVTGSDSDGQAD